MAVSKQKLKLLYLLQILYSKTDENHSLNASEIIKILEANDFKSERKTIYSDVDTLKDFGIDIIRVAGKDGGYYIGERAFEVAELKLLVDAVQSSKFITEKKSRELIKKLQRLSSESESKQLDRKVFISNRAKAGNETIYYVVDVIHNAMSENRSITFQYTEWNIKKKLVPKNQGKYYKVSPWELTWCEDNYYLIAFDEARGEIRHYRVDKILGIKKETRRRTGQEAFKDFNLPAFLIKTFSMFGGHEEKVTLRCHNSQVGVILDRFGKDISIYPSNDKDYFKVIVTIAVSPQFFGWLVGIGGGIIIEKPERVKAEYLEYLEKIVESEKETK